MKKYIFASFLFFLFLCGIKNVEASTLTYEFTGWYYGKSRDGITTFSSYYLRDYKVDGNIAYCVEPLKDEGTDQYIIGKWEDLGLSNSIKDKVLLYAYYGYGYPGHYSLRYRAAAQALIWEAIGDGYSIIYNTKMWNKGDIINVDREKKEIKNLVDHHFDKPIFDNKTYKALVKEPIVIEDTNQELINYSLESSENANVSITNNTIKVVPNKPGKITISFSKRKKYSKPYIVYYSKDYQNLLGVGNVDDVISTFTIDASYGQVEVYKKDSETNTPQGASSLEGAIYGIYTPNGSLITKVTTNQNGYGLSSKNIPYGSYYLKEITPSKGYMLDPNTYNFTVDKEKVTLNVKENVIKGKIKIIKKDNDTDSCLKELENAQYGIYNSKNNLVSKLTINEKCEATSPSIPFDNYIIKEILPPNGYTIDKNIYTANIKDESIIEIISKDEIIKNKIKITKKYDISPNNNYELIGEDNISFEIYSSDILYNTITTNNKGIAEIELPYGEYKFHQVNTKEGYKKVDDFTVIVNENSKKEQEYNLTNERFSSYLKIYKIDSETKNIINDYETTFKILDIDNNSYVTEIINDQEYNEFTTTNGYYITNIPLKSGNYKIIEIKSPYGYLLNNDGILFSINENTVYKEENNSKYIEIYFENTPIKGQIKIHKDGEKINFNNGEFIYSKTPLENIKYNLYHDSTLIETITTDKFGNGISKPLPLGDYCLIESSTNNNYILDKTKHCFRVKANNNSSPIVEYYYEFENILKKGKLIFTKIDPLGNLIPNTTVEIYNSKNEIIYNGNTNEFGEIIISNLPIDKYFIKEISPAKGFLPTDEIIEFEITDKNDIVNKTMINRPTPIDVPYTYKNDVNYNCIILYIGFIYYEIKKKSFIN